jgi:indolepyruvate ferredoxin oxidoreductase beta subunit
MSADTTTNIVVAGLGGQGVIKASDILADALLRAGYDVKKAEVHGMSQRGGSVHTDVRFGENVLSPMVPEGAADILLLLEATQLEPNKHYLAAGGRVIGPDLVVPPDRTLAQLDKDDSLPITSRNLNVALLGALSTCLDIADEHWRAAVQANLPERLHKQNLAVFDFGREKAA